MVVNTARGASGTGFFVDAEHVVTNSHVVRGATEVEITSQRLKTALPGQVMARTGDDTGKADFALVKLTGPRITEASLPIASTVAKLDPVVAAGYPGIVVKTDGGYIPTLQSDGKEV